MISDFKKPDNYSGDIIDAFHDHSNANVFLLHEFITLVSISQFIPQLCHITIEYFNKNILMISMYFVDRLFLNVFM